MFKWIEDMEKLPYLLLKVALLVIIGCFGGLIAYIINCDSLTLLFALEKTVPCLAVAVLIAFGGSFALDYLLKDIDHINKTKKH